MHRRHFRSVAMVAALTMGIAACSSGDPGASADNEGWHIPEEAPTATIQVLTLIDPDAENMRPILEAFNEAYPTITVEHESVPFDQLNSMIDARVSSQDGNPDVYWADQPRIAALASRGYAEDLTEVFAEYRDLWEDSAYEGSSYDDRLWAVPLDNSTQLMYYNKELLDAAGVDYPSGDPASRTTWEELAEDAAEVIAAGAQNGIVFGQVDRYYQLQPLMASLGGSAGGTGDSNLTPDITSDPWVEAMEWYGSIFEDGLSNRGVAPEQSDADFLAGNTAYLIQSPVMLTKLQESDIDWGVAAHPMFDGGVAATPSGSWSMAMSPFSDEKEAAAIYLRWMSSEGGGGYVTHRTDTPLPANIEGKATYLESEIFQTDEGQKAAEIIDHETTETAISRLSTVGYVEFEEILGRAFSDIRNGTDARTALESAERELTSAWAKYQ